MKLRVTVALFALSTLVSTLTTSSAHAQLSDAEKKAAARAAFKEGVELQDSGQPSEALVRFEKAQKLYDAPTHLLHIAECQAVTGKLVEAVETYTNLVNKTLDKDAPEAFVQAQTQAKAELKSLQQRVPTMRVLIKPDPRTLQNLQITVNDRQLPPELVDVPRPVNPGAYRLSASATGWGTPTPSQVDVHEKEASVVTLTLQKGAVAAVVAPTAPASTADTSPSTSTTTAPATEAPAPYDQAAKPANATSGPSAAGLLLGVRPAWFVPTGSVAAGQKFNTVASSGPGVGIDLIGRVAKILLVGGTLEIAGLGAPSDKSRLSSAGKSEVSATSVYAGVLLGILPNVDKVSFIGDLGFGMRWLSHSVESPDVHIDETFNGWELGLNAGLSLPIGPIRVVPKVGISFGSFSDRITPTATTATDTLGDSAGHTMLTAGLGIYYHLDFTKKPKVALGSPTSMTAGR